MSNKFGRDVLRKFAGGLSALMIVSTAAQAQETIVGEWRFEDGICIPSDGAMHIGPKSITGDTHFCDFDTVSRSGDVVTWKGACGFPEPMQATTVIARLQGKRLTVAYDGAENGPYVRC